MRCERASDSRIDHCSHRSDGLQSGNRRTLEPTHCLLGGLSSGMCRLPQRAGGQRGDVPCRRERSNARMLETDQHTYGMPRI